MSKNDTQKKKMLMINKHLRCCLMSQITEAIIKKEWNITVSPLTGKVWSYTDVFRQNVRKQGFLQILVQSFWRAMKCVKCYMCMPIYQQFCFWKTVLQKSLYKYCTQTSRNKDSWCIAVIRITNFNNLNASDIK